MPKSPESSYKCAVRVSLDMCTWSNQRKMKDTTFKRHDLDVAIDKNQSNFSIERFGAIFKSFLRGIGSEVVLQLIV